MGRKLLDPIFYFVAKSSSHEAFLSIILTTVLLMSFVTQGDNETKLFFFSDPFEFSVFDFLLNTQDLEVELFQDYSVYPTWSDLIWSINLILPNPTGLIQQSRIQCFRVSDTDTHCTIYVITLLSRHRALQYSWRLFGWSTTCRDEVPLPDRGRHCALQRTATGILLHHCWLQHRSMWETLSILSPLMQINSVWPLSSFTSPWQSFWNDYISLHF